MHDSGEVLTRARLEGIAKLRAAGVKQAAAAFLLYEHEECEKNPLLALRRVSSMGMESRLDLGRRAATDIRVHQRSGDTNRYEVNVLDASGISKTSDPDRDAYLERKYGLRDTSGSTALGTMKLDADGNEIAERANA